MGTLARIRSALIETIPGTAGLAPAECGRDSPLQAAAEAAARDGAFTGGPAEYFHAVGVNQLVTLLEAGLMPDHCVLDIGCGCLRGGYWLVHFLNAGCFFGIEPSRERLQLGLDRFVPAATIAAKAPRFDTNADFDFGVFGVKFDFVVARSIWTHASPDQVTRMLDQFAQWSTPHGKFLTSYLPAGPLQRQYEGGQWAGRSHESDDPALARYQRSWLADQCRSRGLVLTQPQSRNMFQQIWALVTHA